MKIGILSSSPACVTLLRQLLPSHDCRICDTADSLMAACADSVALLVLDLDAWTTPPGDSAAMLHVMRTACSVPQISGDAPAGARQDNAAPAIFLLATSSQKSLLLTLRSAGADDYLLKPIRRVDLALRLEVLLHTKTTQADARPPEEVGGFMFDLGRLRVTRANRPSLDAVLTQKEIALAQLLLHNLGRPLSRAFLRERIWGSEPEIPTRTIDTHISRVRTKLGLKPEHGFRLATVYGYGYQLEHVDAPVTQG